MKKNKKKNKDKQKTVLIITIVALIIALVAGGTYAWWTWSSGNNTSVNITVGSMTMNLDGGGDITSQNLVPTSCTNTTYAIQRTITYSVDNPTSVDATATIQLEQATSSTVLSNSLKTKLSYLKWKLTTSANCSGTEVASGDFSTANTKGAVLDLTSQVGTVKTGSTYYVPAKTITPLTGTYYLSIWLDSSYTANNTGGSVSDIFQDKTFTFKLTGTIAQNES